MAASLKDVFKGLIPQATPKIIGRIALVNPIARDQRSKCRVIDHDICQITRAVDRHNLNSPMTIGHVEIRIN